MLATKLSAPLVALALVALDGCSKDAPQPPKGTVPSPPAPPPAPGPALSDEQLAHVKDAEAKAVPVIEKAGGIVTRDPAGRVTEVLLLGKQFSDADMKHISGLLHLRTLNISDTQVTDTGLAELKTLVNLDTLVIGSLNATGANLKELAGLKSLRHLNFTFAKVSDEGLKDIALLTGLKELILMEAEITDATLKEIAKLKDLEVLDLNGARKVTDAGLKELLVLEHLRTLRISSTGVTDAGLLELTKLKKLDAIFLVFCKVSADAVKQFKAAKPKCTVIK